MLMKQNVYYSWYNNSNKLTIAITSYYTITCRLQTCCLMLLICNQPRVSVIFNATYM